MTMRNLYLLVLLVGFSFAGFAQHCQGVDTTAISPRPDSVGIFTPGSDAMPCIVRAQPVSDTLYFTVFNKLSGFTVESMTIDSIGNLPAGLCWASNVSGNTFAAHQNGVIYISGQSYVSAGQYKLQVYVHITTSVTSIPFSTLESIAGLRYYLRVICPGGICEAIDTARGRDSLYIPYSQACGVGIHELSTNLSDISVSPNPLTNETRLTFTAAREGAVTCRIYDLLGHVISSRDLNTLTGINTLSIDRTGLSSGLYILSISDGSSAATQKIIVE